MALRKSLSLSLFFFLSMSQLARADLTKILNEYTALVNDVGLLSGVFSGSDIKLLTPEDKPWLNNREYSARSVVSVFTYADHSNALASFIAVLKTFLSCARDTEVKTLISNVVLGAERAYRPLTGTRDKEDWDTGRNAEITQLAALRAQVKEIIVLARIRLTASERNAQTFLDRAKGDPSLVSKEMLESFEAAKAEIARIETVLTQLREEEATSRARVAALRKEEEIAKAGASICGDIEVARRTFAAESEKLAALKKEVEACQRNLGSMTAECAAVQRQTDDKRRELERVYDETYKCSMERQRKHVEDSFPREDLVEFPSIELVENDKLKESLRATIKSLLNAAITAFFPAHRSPGSFVKCSVEVVKCRPGTSIHKMDPMMRLKVRLGAVGMEKAIVQEFDKFRLETLRETLKKFFEDSVPVVLKAAIAYYEEEMRRHKVAAEDARQKGDSMRNFEVSYQQPPPAPSAPMATPGIYPQVFVPEGYRNETGPNNNNAAALNYGIRSTAFSSFQVN